MAQRTLHYAFGEHLAAACGVADRPRFLLGSVLPDAYREHRFRDATHYIRRAPDGQHYYEFERFRSEFPALVQSDALYLGYYMHLVVDAFYRQFCHGLHRLYFRSEERVRLLHRDYRLLNAYLVQSRGLRDCLELPADFSQEAIHRIAPFAAEEFLREMRKDFHEHPEGKTTFLTEAMIDDFLERYLPPAEEELRAVQAGASHLRAADIAWQHPPE